MSISAVNFGSNYQTDRIEKNSKIAKNASIIAAATGVAALTASAVALHKVNGVSKEAQSLFSKVPELISKVKAKFNGVLDSKIAPSLDKFKQNLKIYVENLKKNPEFEKLIKEFTEKLKTLKNEDFVKNIMGKLKK